MNELTTIKKEAQGAKNQTGLILIFGGGPIKLLKSFPILRDSEAAFIIRGYGEECGDIPAERQIVRPKKNKDTIFYNSEDLEEFYENRDYIAAPLSLDLDFQLENFAKERRVLFFGRDKEIFFFQDGEYRSSAPLIIPRDENSCRYHISKYKRSSAVILIENQAPEKIVKIVAYLEKKAAKDRLAYFNPFKKTGGKIPQPGFLGQPVKDSPKLRMERSAKNGKIEIYRRELIADMTGMIELGEGKLSYAFLAGALHMIKKDGKILCGPGLNKAGFRSDKREIFLERESSFSFDGENIRGLRQVLVYTHKTDKARIFCDYFLCGDYQGLFVSLYCQYPRGPFEFYDSYRAWEFEIGVVAAEEKIIINRGLNGKYCLNELEGNSGTYNIPADEFYIEAGELKLGLKIINKRKSEEIVNLYVKPKSKHKKTIALALLAGECEICGSEIHGYGETLSFCLYPGNPKDFPVFPKAAAKEAYPAAVWENRRN